ncbi:MAG TPA: YdeI/OmpD-associated family protein [Methanotrichaceae archaeon]|nr:YdeI/OmpD-associated family protein [Methanotrichaceae archaeon]
MILSIDNRDEWRSWLEKNHSTVKEVWLVYYKKHTGKPRIPYEDAVEEALCFGWIDSTVKRLDEDRFAQKFTPRKDKSRWSLINKKRARKMIREGKMTKAGLAKIQDLAEADDRETPEAKPAKKSVETPQFMKDALMANGTAWENFNNMANSYRRSYIMWITSAKKDETRQRRLHEAIGLLEQNKKLGMK